MEEQAIKDIRRIVRPGTLPSDWTLRPRVGISYLRTTRDATDETGGSAFALSVERDGDVAGFADGRLFFGRSDVDSTVPPNRVVRRSLPDKVDGFMH